MEEEAEEKEAEHKANWSAEKQAFMEAHKVEMEQKRMESDKKLAEAEAAH